MLAPMNPPPSFDYKAFGHHHHHHGEPQHGELDASTASHYAGHHAAPHYGAWPSHANLTAFGGAFDNHDEDDDDEPDHDLDHDDHTPASATAPRKARKPSASGSKKEVFVCPEVHCGKTFPRSFALRRHMRIHTGTKPYACDVDGCAQRFNTSGNLSRHKRIHSGERPYPCVFASCGKRFNTSTKLKRHMRIHFPDGQSLFHCVQHACTFACDNYKEYVHHQRQHGNPAYAKDDENVDRANLPPPPDAKPTTTTTTSKPKTKPAARTKPPRVSKASKAAAAATTAALTGDYRFEPPPAGLSLLMKEAHRDDEYPDQRRRLPFPTGAFPSESIAGASPMNLSLATAFGASSAFASAAAGTARAPPTSSQPFYDHAGSSSTSTSSFPSYLRGPPSDAYASHHHHHHQSHQHQQQQHSYHDSIHFPPLRPEDDGGDDGYDSGSPRHHQDHHQGHATHHHHQGHAHHHDQRHGDDSEDDKYGGYSSVPHAVGSDFTGEELSAVLELMKDS